jgi:hypothetical protein
MPVRQRLSTTEDGRSVLVKHASPGESAERLAHEAAVLRAAAHPGVVELVAERELAGGAREVMLAMAGSRTAADVQIGIVGAAGLVTSLAATVADLHDLGIAHGRIRPEHVVVDGTGRPLLCGFGDAIRAESGALAVEDRAADVAGLGGLLRRLVTAGDGDPLALDESWEPIPARRFFRDDRWTGHARRSLLNVADQATADEPAHRPSARGLAAAVLAALPEARLPGAVGSTSEAALPPPGSAWPLRRSALRRRLDGVAALAGRSRSVRVWPLAPVAGAVGLGLLVFGIGGLLRSPVPAASRAAASRPTTTVPVPPPPSSTPSAADTTSTTDTSTTTAAACARVSPPAADPDGDGCPSPVAIGDGWVAVDGVRYAVGQAGDLLAVGDWECDGRATVAVVRRPGGEVFLFPGWASEGTELVVPVVTTVPSPASVSVDDHDGDGCPTLVVSDASGRRAVVEP